MVLKSLLAASLLATAVFAAPMTISTGTAALWTVNGNPVAVENPIPTPTWIGNFGDGRWVGTSVSDATIPGGAAPGTYIYRLNIGTYLGGTGSFGLQYAADNSVTWTITTGTLAGTTSCDATVNPVGDCFGAGAGAPRSLTGTYSLSSVLTATVVNGDTFSTPSGLLVVGTAANEVDPIG